VVGVSRVPSRGGGRSRGRSVLVLLVVVVALAGVAVPAASFSTADVPRGTSVSVVGDSNGVVGLDRATSVQAGQDERLVTVTDRFDGTISLSMSIPQSDGELKVDTDGDGQYEVPASSTVQFGLGDGGSAEVYIDAAKQSGNPKEITYDVSGEADGASFRMQRTVGVRNGNGNGGGNGKPAASDVYTITENGDLQKTFEVDQGYDPEWDFGDGTTSNQYYVQHRYPAEGSYTVTLDVIIDGTEYTYTETVQANQFGSGADRPPRDEVLSVSDAGYLEPRERIFEVEQGYNPEWDFDDGTTSDQYYIEHQFPGDGAYTVTLEVTIDGVRYQYTRTVTISDGNSNGNGNGNSNGSGSSDGPGNSCSNGNNPNCP
jgi:VCBS repeat-containing protein